MLEKIGKKAWRRRREREILSEKRVCQWRSGKINKSKRKMGEYRVKWKGQRHRQVRNNRVRNDRGNSRVPGEREWKRKKNDLDVGTRREKTGIGWKEKKEDAECAMRRERQSSTCGMNVTKWERERKRKEREEILNEDGREIRWMNEIWKRRGKIEKKRGGE
jgi:hypothetical protein